MPYITPSELAVHYASAEISQLADRDGDDMDDAGVILSAINRATAEIDQHLAACYVLPLQPAVAGAAIDAWVLERLKDWCGVLARYKLWTDTRRNSENDLNKPEPRLRYEDALKQFKDISANGCILLGSSVLKVRDTQITPQSPMIMVADHGSVWRRDRGVRA